MQRQAATIAKLARLTITAASIFLTSQAFANEVEAPSNSSTPSNQGAAVNSAKAPIEDRVVASTAGEKQEVTAREDVAPKEDAEPGFAAIEVVETGKVYTLQEDQSTAKGEPGVAEIEMVESGEKYVIREGETEVEKQQSAESVSTEALGDESAASDTLSGTALTTSPTSPAMSIEEQTEQPSMFSKDPGGSTIDALIAVPVVNAKGEQLGTVEEVVMNTETGAAGLVVAVISEHEQSISHVVVPADEVTPQGTELLWQTDMGKDELAQQQSYDPSRYERVSQIEGSVREPQSASLSQL